MKFHSCNLNRQSIISDVFHLHEMSVSSIGDPPAPISPPGPLQKLGRPQEGFAEFAAECRKHEDAGERPDNEADEKNHLEGGVGRVQSFDRDLNPDHFEVPEDVAQGQGHFDRPQDHGCVNRQLGRAIRIAAAIYR